MFTPWIVVLAICLYMALLFALAQWAEKRLYRNREPRIQPWVYALSIGVYTTAWGYYGDAGIAASSGLIFLAFDLGACLMMVLWWWLLRRIIKVKESLHITSIADFISARYNRSQGVAVLVTAMTLLGTIPYLALQLKAVVMTYGLITTGSLTEQLDWGGTGLMVTIFMILFTILFGARRLDPTERHPGVMFVLAAESVVKLLALLALALYVTYGLFDGLQDFWQQVNRLENNPLNRIMPGERPYLLWTTYMILGMAGIQFLPRLFHVSVVENAHTSHVRTAMWLFTSYLLLVSLFPIPVAGASLVFGLPPEQAEMAALLLPLQNNQALITLFTFLGGFSAAMGMLIISTMTLATMTTNHLLIPFLERHPPLQGLRHYLLQCRWLAIVLILLAGYGGARTLDHLFLVSLGIIALSATLQFVPAILGGFIWRGGSAAGALLGLGCGFVVWFYTLIVPPLAEHGWLPLSLLTEGPWQVAWLRPQALLGLDMLPPVTHSLFWTLLFNISAYILGSLAYPPHSNERVLTNEFLQASELSPPLQARPKGLRDYIELEPKLLEAKELLSRYMPKAKVDQTLNMVVDHLLAEPKSRISIMELVEFHRMVERELTGAIGAASAHHAMETSIKYSEREAMDLQAVYSDILSELLVTPQELSQRAEHLPAESTVQDRTGELEAKIREREAEILHLQRQNQALQQNHQASQAKLQHEQNRVRKVMRLLKQEISRRRQHQDENP